LEETLANKEKELAALERINYINERMIEIKDKQIEGDNRNFEQMKDIADRYRELAKMSKPKSVWETWGPLGIIAIIVVTIASAI
jgi:DNA helicase IV